MAGLVRVRSRFAVLAMMAITGWGGSTVPAAIHASTDGPATHPAAGGTIPNAPAPRPDAPGWAVRAVPASVSLGSGGSGATAGGDPSIRGPVPAAARYSPPRTATEVPEQRTATSRTIANPDGTFTLEAYPERIHYQDPAGEWTPIDLTLVPDTAAADGSYDLAVAANDRVTRFATADGSAALAELSVDGVTVRVRALGYEEGAKDAGRNAVTFGAAAGAPQLYARPTEVGFEIGATWADATASPTVTYVLEVDGATAELSADGATVVLRREATAKDGSPLIEDAGSISAPVIIEGGLDEGAPVRDQTIVRTTLLRPGDELPVDAAAELEAGLGPTEYLLRYELDPAWLADPARVFPVILDPTVCAGAQSGCTGTNSMDTFIISGLPTQYPTGYTFLRMGKDTGDINDGGVDYKSSRPLLYFDFLDLPDGAHITSASLYARIGVKYGTPSGQTLYARRVIRSWSGTTTWNDMTSPTTGWTTTGQASVTMPSGNDLTLDVSAITRAWYTRRAPDWRRDLGFILQMGDEAQADEITLKRKSDGTSSYRPKLTITYVTPKVGLDFDANLGPTYSPSSLVAGIPTTIPVVLENKSGSGATFDTCTGTSDTDCYRLGYRFLDAQGALKSSGTQDLDAAITVDHHATIGLSVTPPSVGQYTLRFDLVHRLGGASGTYVWASDWAEPAKYWSRNKKLLSPGSVRWVGSSGIERLEASVAVGTGGGGVGEVRAVATGTGGTLGIDLAARNLLYREETGLGFADLVPLGLRYGYNSADATGCAGYQGILGACGWYTNWDERLTPGTEAGTSTYQDPDGRRHLVATDGAGQLVSGAPVWLTRQRVTIVDENRPSDSPTKFGTASSFGVATYSGASVWRDQTSVSTSLGAFSPLDLNAYRSLRFAVRTSSSPSTAIVIKVRNVSDDSIGDDGEQWFAYTIGTDWATGHAQKNVSGSPLGTWKQVAVDLFSDIITDGTFGERTDRYEVLEVKLKYKSGAAGSTYFDAVRFEGYRSTWYSDTEPAWTANGTVVNADGTDPADGASALRAAPSTWAGRATCLDTSGCRSAFEITNMPLLTWRWKKVGGSSVAMAFQIKNIRTGASDWITYYAGSAAPAGAVNPLKVADTLPTEWTTVTRNVREDARAVLGYYNDTDGGLSIADRVTWVGWSPWAPDGGYGLFDWMYVSTIAEVDPRQTNQPDAPDETFFLYDYSAIYPDRSVHYFNRDGLLERIGDRDGNTLELDWTYAATGSGPATYTLERIRGAADGLALASGTADRELVLAEGTAGGFATYEFAEQLGSTTSDQSTRRATFWSPRPAAPRSARAISWRSPPRAPSTSPAAPSPTAVWATTTRTRRATASTRSATRATRARTSTPMP